jgi:hypothetical protein
LTASSDELQNLFSKKNYRKRDKSNYYFELPYKGLSKFSRLIILLVNKRIIFKSIIIKVPKPTEKEQKFIRDMFHESNLEFAEAKNIDLNKMNKHNYKN